MTELDPERREELLSAVLAASPGTPTLTCRKIADAIAPLIAGWLEDERHDEALHAAYVADLFESKGD
jgi:hypothetical protein